jgi:transcriptional regulator with XRE-family HTH domain
VPSPTGANPRAIFARNVAAAREARGLTQEALGWAAGLHQTEIARIERGTRNAGLETIAKIARGLGVPAASLLEGINEGADIRRA